MESKNNLEWDWCKTVSEEVIVVSEAVVRSFVIVAAVGLISAQLLWWLTEVMLAQCCVPSRVSRLMEAVVTIGNVQSRTSLITSMQLFYVFLEMIVKLLYIAVYNCFYFTLTNCSCSCFLIIINITNIICYLKYLLHLNRSHVHNLTVFFIFFASV